MLGLMSTSSFAEGNGDKDCCKKKSACCEKIEVCCPGDKADSKKECKPEDVAKCTPAEVEACCPKK